jgi:nucleoside-diphosphate-sugar epimerase
VHLNAPPFFENVRALIAQSVADQDTIFLPWGGGDAIFPLVAADDVARVAAALLAGPSTARQNRYDLIGEIPTVSEIVSSLSTVLRRPVRYVEITDERWEQAVEGRLDPHALDHLSHLWQYFRTSGIRKGEDGFRVSDAIAALTGTAPQTLDQFFEANADAFGGVGPRERGKGDGPRGTPG